MVTFGGREVSFQSKVQGTWGEFRSAGGTIQYLMTNARLGAAGTDLEFRLTAHLRPVREILDVSDMDFNELLQRDLDDHRVATDLIPYLLGLQPSSHGGGSQSSGPAFFPPVLAFLLPFGASGQLSSFPSIEGGEVVEDDIGDMYEDKCGDAFRIRRAYDSHGNQFARERFGSLEWNPERARLVVLDGQHRAMALLAIDRTLRDSWDMHDIRAARYAPFYRTRVSRLLENAGVAERLEMLQLPVTVCWFAGESDPLEGARKLFVDVNKNARPPSQARLVLLSDSELTSIFTRTVLNELRAGSGDELPLYAIEYDNPDPSGSTRPARWSTLVTINLLTDLVDRLMLGDPKYIVDVNREMRGRENSEDRHKRLRKQLGVGELFGEEIDDDGTIVERDRITNTHFPHSGLEELQGAFLRSWGRAIIRMLSSIGPYRAHCDALKELDEDWPSVGAGVAASLAHEAVFEGVGLYWTLKNSADYFRRVEAREIEERTGSKPSKAPDTVVAWDLVLEKREEFETKRASAYLGEAASTIVANEVFDVYLTHACILGLALTAATLAHDNGVFGEDVDSLVDVLAGAVNRSLDAESEGDQDRRTFLAKSTEDTLTIHTIRQMNSTRCVQFRYFWLELLAALPSEDSLYQTVDRAELLLRRDQARSVFVKYRTKEQQQQLYKADTSKPKTEYFGAAQQQVLNELQEALGYWFSLEETEFLSWLKSYSFAESETDEEEVELEEAEGDGAPAE